MLDFCFSWLKGLGRRRSVQPQHQKHYKVVEKTEAINFVAVITLEEAKNLEFIYDDEDPEGIERWGVLKCGNPDVYVRLRKAPNHYVGYGFVFVVHFYGKRFGFITEIDFEKTLCHMREDGAFVWVFRHMCIPVSIPDKVNGKHVARYHGGGRSLKASRSRKLS